MKKILILIAVIFATGCPSTQQHSAPSPASPIPAGTPTYRAYVKGLVCPSCAVGLKNGLMKLPFVKLIHVNYKTGLVLIYEIHPRIDPKGIKKYDKSRITKAVEDSGYDVDRFEKD